ncbi:MAG TPA: hypothetical protein VE988_22785 [Gemmataceae bacterium]|nr:hypothetical protein [Gemmataceae bacterium]
MYRMLATEVRQAIGWARLKAEMELHENDAKTWLLYGPGKETAVREGWGRGGKTAGAETESDDWMEVCALLVEALAPFPEARMAAAEALAKRSESNLQRGVDNGRGQP